MLSLSAPFISTFFKDALGSVMPYTDYILGNEAEALAFSESHSWGITDIVEIAKKMATLPKKNSSRSRTVIITQGTGPTIAAATSEAGEVDAKQLPVREIPKDEINDTNGAG
jgi:adenosine kinase